MPWTFAVALDRLQAQPQVVKLSPRQIAMFDVEGQIYAIDNRCPHEGYPLVKGSIDESCVLTCNWHNWKFQLADGECILGGDHVRSYPVEVRGTEVWVNTDDPPRDVLEPQILLGLKSAFAQRDFGRICREIARLQFNGIDATTSICEALEWSYERLEFGFTHAFAVAPDWLELSSQHDGDFSKQLICLAESVDHMAWDVLRHREYPYASSATELDAGFDESRFVQAVEAQELERAESLAAASVAANIGPRRWDEVEHAFATAALAHYNDFGHSLIYVYKTSQLQAQLGEASQRPLRLALARHLVYTTREDLVPEFSGYAEAVVRLAKTSLRSTPEGPALDGATSGGAAPTRDDLEPPFPASVRTALDWVLNACKSHPIDVVYDRLLLALAQNLLHFDLSVDQATHRPVSDNVGWLDFTHGVTFANAVRGICERHPDLWGAGLLQMALFVGRNHAYIDPTLDTTRWQVDDEAKFFADLDDRLLDHGQRDPIFSAHFVKTTLAIREELPHASNECRSVLLAGLHRFHASPIKQKHARRLARQALELVQRDFAD